MATSTLWRVHVTANNGGDNLEWADIQFRTTVGSPLAFPMWNNGDEIGASYYSSGGPPLYGADGDADTSFIVASASTNLPAWWSYTYQSPIQILSYAIQSGPTLGDPAAVNAPKDFTLEYSDDDGSTWTVADTQTGQTGWGDHETREYTVGVAGYTSRVGLWNAASKKWRLNITAANGGTRLGIVDMQLHEVVGQYLNQDNWAIGADSPYASASSGASPGNAFDSDLSSAWYSDSGVTAATLQINHNRVFAPHEYVIAATSAGEAPRSWTLDYWSDASSSWIVADTQTNQSLTTSYAVYGVAANASATTPTDTTGNGAVNLGNTSNATGIADTTPFLLSGVVSQSTDGLMFGDMMLELIDAAGVIDPPMALMPLTLAGFAAAGNVSAGNAQMVMQPFTAAGAMDGPLSLPALSLSASGVAGTVGAGTSLLQPMDAAGSLTAGNAGIGAAVLQPFDAVAYFGNAGNVVLPMVDASATGAAGADSYGTLQAERFTLAGTASADALPAQGDAAMLPLDVAGTLLGGTVSDGAAVLLAASANGTATATVVIDGSLTLPAFDATGAGVPGVVADGNVALSALTASGAGIVPPPDNTGDGSADLSALTLAGALISGRMADGAASLPALTLSASGLAENIAQGAADLLALTASGLLEYGGAPTFSDGAVTLAQVQVAGQGTTGTIGSGAAILQAASLSAQAYADTTATGDATLGFVALSASGIASIVAVGAAVLSPAMVDGAAVGGHIGSASITVPLMTLDASGFMDAAGTATVSLPVLSLEAVGTAGDLNPVFTGIALNTHNRAVSTYDGLAFNSMTQFNGLVLAATAAGIVALTGDTDQGSPITATVTTGISDLGAEPIKRVLAGYVGYRAAGDLELTMITDEHDEYVYRLEPRRLDQLHAARVKFGRGAEGRYWQWKLTNRGGADFALDTLSLDAQTLSRRVR
jgi:hypothetical protein